MTGAISLPRDLQDRLEAYAQEHGLTERQALEELIPRQGDGEQTSVPEDTLTPAERRRAAQGRRDIEEGEFMDGPAFFDSLRQ